MFDLLFVMIMTVAYISSNNLRLLIFKITLKYQINAIFEISISPPVPPHISRL